MLSTARFVERRQHDGRGSACRLRRSRLSPDRPMPRAPSIAFPQSRRAARLGRDRHVQRARLFPTKLLASRSASRPGRTHLRRRKRPRNTPSCCRLHKSIVATGGRRVGRPVYMSPCDVAWKQRRAWQTADRLLGNERRETLPAACAIAGRFCRPDRPSPTLPVVLRRPGRYWCLRCAAMVFPTLRQPNHPAARASSTSKEQNRHVPKA